MGNAEKKLIIFTDLDGTLLDHETYSFKEATEALEKIKKTGTPVIFVTSKTFAEVKVLQEKMSLWKKEPFIVESGGAIFLPKKFFSFNLRDIELSDGKLTEEPEFWRIEFGKPYELVRGVLKETANETETEIKGIGDMTAKEFAQDSGLSEKEAQLAKERMYQEGFKIIAPENEKETAQEKLKKAIGARGYYMSAGGRYHQIMASPAKVRAVNALKELFRVQCGDIFCVGLGDAPADLEFMELCDEGYLIKNPKKIVEVDLMGKKMIKKIPEIGPSAWNKIVLEKLRQNINGERRSPRKISTAKTA